MEHRPVVSQPVEPAPGSYEGARLANLRAFAAMSSEQKVQWLAWMHELLYPYLHERGQDKAITTNDSPAG